MLYPYSASTATKVYLEFAVIKNSSLFLQAMNFFSSCKGIVCFEGLEQTADY